MHSIRVDWMELLHFPLLPSQLYMSHLQCYSKRNGSFNKAVKKIFVYSAEWQQYVASVQFSQLLSRKMSWCQWGKFVLSHRIFLKCEAPSLYFSGWNVRPELVQLAIWRSISTVPGLVWSRHGSLGIWSWSFCQRHRDHDWIQDMALVAHCLEVLHTRCYLR